MTFYYKDNPLPCPDDIAKELAKYLNFYVITPGDFFETLENIGFEFPITFSDLQIEHTNSSFLCKSADNSMEYRIELNRHSYSRRGITLFDGNEKCSYCLNSGEPYQYIFECFDKTPIIKFIREQQKDSDCISIYLKNSNKKFEFEANIYDAKNSKIPNLVIKETSFSLIDENHSSITSYLLSLRISSSILDLYDIFSKYYCTSHFQIEFFTRPFKQKNEKFVISKLNIEHSQIVEYADYNHETTYSEVYHLFANGDWSFETPNYSLKFDKEDDHYFLLGSWSKYKLSTIDTLIQYMENKKIPTLSI